MIRLLFLFLPTTLFGQGSFNVQLIDHWHEDSLMSTILDARYSDCWGYENGDSEYAMIGSTEGVHFFEIENNRFQARDFVQGKYSSANVIHRDIKTYLNYAYTVCDEGTSSLQIIDLSYLPDSVHVVYENDSTFTRVHNLTIDQTSGLMYVCSVQPSSGGVIQPLISMQVYSLLDPENPILVYEGPNDIPEVHDAYVRDNIAYLNCGFDGFRVYDFSNPSSPQFLQNTSFYLDQGYNHQGWLSPDGTKYVFADETNGKKLKNCVVDNAHVITIKNQFGTNYEDGSVPHNVVVTNEFAFVAYYNEGLRIFDLRPGIPQEVAHYDTYPKYEELFKMNGAWGVYTDLPSQRILVSDRQNGLFLLNFDRTLFTNQGIEDELSVYPNPISSGQNLSIKLEVEEFSDFKLQIFDYLGKLVENRSVVDQSYDKFSVNLSNGMYLLKASYQDYLGKEITITKKIAVL